MLLRVTGLLLGVLLMTHVYLAYFAVPGGQITFATVQGRMHSAILYVDLLLLYVALFHGLYGAKVVLADLVPAWKESYVTAFLALCGLGLSIYGTKSLFAFTA